MRNPSAVALFLGAAAAAGCGGGAGSPAPEARVAVTQGNCFVCVIDVSASMIQNDKHGYAEQAAQMAVSLLNEGTNFAAVAFSSEARIVCDWRRIEPGDARREVQKKVSGLARRGGTNFIAALEKARELAERTRARGAVVFLTDGEHKVGGKTDKVREQVAFFESKGWPIYTIGFSRKADTALLQEMAARTGGAYFKAEEPEQLLSAFVSIVSVTEGLFVRQGPFAPVTVMPGTGRLIYLAARKGAGAKIADAKLNGAAHRASDVHRFPATSDPRAAVELLSYERPGAGIWETNAVGPVGECATLIRPPLTIELAADAPRAKYVDGQTVQLGLIARSDTPEVLSGLRAHSRVSAEIKSEATGAVTDSVELPVQDVPETSPVVFQGRTVAKLSEPGKAETMTAQLRCSLAWAPGEEWTHGKIVSYQVVPPEGLFDVQPKKLDFGWLWSDSEGERRRLAILSHQDESVFQASSQIPELSFDPGRVSLHAAEEWELVGLLRPTRTTQPGDISGEVLIALDIGDVSGKRYEERVPVSARVLRFEGGDLVELPSCKPGGSVAHPLAHRTEPEARLVWPAQAVLTCTRLGPDSLPAKGGGPAKPAPTLALSVVQGASGGVEIRGDVSEDLPAGLYEGALTVEVDTGQGAEAAARPEASGQARLQRKLRVLLPLGEPMPVLLVLGAEEPGAARLQALSFQAVRPGWAETRLVLVARHVGRGELVRTTGELKGPQGSTIKPRLNIATVPQDGWDGKEMADGVRYGLAYRVYVSSDLVDGEYRGELRLGLLRGGEQVAEAKLPVVLLVNVDRSLDVPPPEQVRPKEPAAAAGPPEMPQQTDRAAAPLGD